VALENGVRSRFSAAWETKTCLAADRMHRFSNSSPMVNDFLFNVFEDKLNTVHEEGIHQ